MKVLVAVDGSSHSKSILKILSSLSIFDEAKFTLCTSVNELKANRFDIDFLDQEQIDSYNQGMTKSCQTMLNDLKDYFKDLGKNSELKLIKGDPKQSLPQLIKDDSYDLIAIGSRGLNPLKDLAMGSTCYSILRQKPCSILLCKPIHDEAYWRQLDKKHTNILLAVNDRSHAHDACTYIANLKDQAANHIHLASFNVQVQQYGIDPMIQKSPKNQNETLNKYAEEIKQHHANWQVSTIIQDQGSELASEVLNYAHEKCLDLIVLGSKYKSASTKNVLGTLTLRLSHSNQLPILIIQ